MGTSNRANMSSKLILIALTVASGLAIAQVQPSGNEAEFIDEPEAIVPENQTDPAPAEELVGSCPDVAQYWADAKAACRRGAPAECKYKTRTQLTTGIEDSLKKWTAACNSNKGAMMKAQCTRYKR